MLRRRAWLDGEPVQNDFLQMMEPQLTPGFFMRFGAVLWRWRPRVHVGERSIAASTHGGNAPRT
jgi:hypothetical protein